MSLFFTDEFGCLARGSRFAAFLAAVVWVFASCPVTEEPEPEDDTKGVKITGITVKIKVLPPEGTVAKGGYADFTAEVYGLDFTMRPEGTDLLSEKDREVKWSIDGSGKAEGTVVTAEGRLIIADNESSSTLTVRATSVTDSTKSGSFTVVVGPDIAAVTNVTVSPITETVSKGGTQAFYATVKGTNNPSPEVKWSIDESSVIKEGTVISGGGVLVIAANETQEMLTVRASSVLDSSKYGIAYVIVTSATVSSVTVDPEAAEVARGGTKTFSAAVTGTNKPSQTVTWSIDEVDIDEGTVISGDGVLVVSPDETNTSLTVRATSALDITKSGTADIRVKSTSATVDGVTVIPEAEEVSRGGTLLFSAEVEGTNSPAQTVLWSIADAVKKEGTGIVTREDGKGVLTVAEDETNATLTVRATSTVNPSKSGTMTVKVIPAPATVTGVMIYPDTAEVPRGSTQIFIPAVSGTGDFTRTVRWSIDESDVKDGTDLTADGKLIVAADEDRYILTVRATSTADPYISGTAIVTVNPATVTGVTISPGTVIVMRGGSQEFSATVEGRGSIVQTVTWSIAGSGVASGTKIDSNGVLTVAESETSGTLTVMAISTADITKYATATVTLAATGTEFAAVLKESVMPPVVTYHELKADTGDDDKWGRQDNPAPVDESKIGNPAVYDAAAGVFKIKNRQGTIHIRFYEVTGDGTTPVVVESGVTGASVLFKDTSITSGMNASLFDLESGAEVTLLLRNANTITTSGEVAGIHVSTGGTLKITSADGDGLASGALTVNGGNSGAGIGGSLRESGGKITIAGGTVTATGGTDAAGIGGGYSGAGGKITIEGSATVVTATGGTNAAGIGGGRGGPGGTITIEGGSVTAGGDSAGIGGGYGGAGGNITISGGTVNARNNGSGAAGIGGGYNGAGGSVIISGNATVVNATGGVNAAGIGGGKYGAGGSSAISGGTVTAISIDSGAGIGGGFNGAGGSVTISGGTVKATSLYGGAGIGGGYGGSGGSVTISVGTATVIATGGTNAAGIGGGWSGAGGRITIGGGTVFAQAGYNSSGEPAAIGGGGGLSIRGKAGTIIISGGVTVAVDGIRSASPYTLMGDDKSVTISGGTVISGGIGRGAADDQINFPATCTPVIFTTEVLDSGTYSGEFPETGALLTGSDAGIDFTGTNGNAATAGKITLNRNLDIPSGATLTIPSGWTLVIPSGITLQNNGTIINKGTINGTVSGNQPQS